MELHANALIFLAFLLAGWSRREKRRALRKGSECPGEKEEARD
jgi:hypothetical protein